MMKLSKSIVLFHILVLTITTMIGCSTKSKSVIEDVEITVLVVDQGTSTLGIQANALLEKSKAMVEEHNPGLTVNLVKVPGEQYTKKIEELNPDVIWVNPSDFERQNKEEKLFDLTPLLENDGIDLSRYFSQNIINMTSIDGKFLGVTLAAYNMAIGYSKEWFDNAGLDYPQENCDVGGLRDRCCSPQVSEWCRFRQKIWGNCSITS